MTINLSIEALEKIGAQAQETNSYWGSIVCSLVASLIEARAEVERLRATAIVLPNLDDHPLQDPAAANRELRKLLYTVDADRKRSDAKVRELATEVWRLRKAMPDDEEHDATRRILRYVGHSGAHRDVCEDADMLRAWVDRATKAAT